MSFFQNACKPRGAMGQLMLSMMNTGHSRLSRWGLSQISPGPGDNVLDVGCGGGANLRRLMKLCPQGFVTGLDYSPASVDYARDYVRKEIAAGRGLVLQGDVSRLVYPDNTFDLVTAFETVYFWPDPRRCFHNIYKAMKPGGTFLICNEADGAHPAQEKWTEKISGMVIYSGPQLEAMLRSAGFSDIRGILDGQGYLAVISRK